MQRTPLLIVEDDQELREIFTRYFTREGYAVVAVSHPRLALEAATFNPFQSAVIDLDLREINGMDLIRRLHAMLPNFQPILLTGREDSLVQQFARNTCVDCLLKPCSLSLLSSAVASAMEDSTAVAAW